MLYTMFFDLYLLLFVGKYHYRVYLLYKSFFFWHKFG